MPACRAAELAAATCQSGGVPAMRASARLRRVASARTAACTEKPGTWMQAKDIVNRADSSFDCNAEKQNQSTTFVVDNLTFRPFSDFYRIASGCPTFISHVAIAAQPREAVLMEQVLLYQPYCHFQDRQIHR